MNNLQNIANILTENIMQTLITEIASPNIYHFTEIGTLISILGENQFKLTYCTDVPQMTGFSYLTGSSLKRSYYLSTTRSRHSYDGYARYLLDGNNIGIARIQLNSDMINSNFHVKASDYYGSSEDNDDNSPWGKRGFYQEIKQGFAHTTYSDAKEAYEDSFHTEKIEREDTIWSNKPYIKNANKYIMKIDILLVDNYDSYDEDMFKTINNLANGLNIPVNYYFSEKVFNISK